MSTTRTITSELLGLLRQHFHNDPKNVLAMNAATRQDFVNLVYRRDVPIDPLNMFSDKVEGENKALSQKSSGRCWIFAALNVLRLQLMRRYKLEDFEFSQSYLFWCDKLEKSNYFLETVLDTFDEPVDGRVIQFLLRAPVQDGGQWDMLVSLVEKYGLVPKSVFPESFHSGASAQLNWLLTSKLREFAATLRSLHEEGKPVVALRQLKSEMLRELHRIVTIVLGAPPLSFDWCFRDKDKKYQAIRGLTPLAFAKEHADIGQLLLPTASLINDPRNEYHRLYTVQYLGNVVDGRPVRYINMPIEELKRAAIASIQAGKSVWFGCDVGKFCHRPSGQMNTKLFDYELAFGVKHQLDKADRLRYGESAMTHAMVLTGVNLIDSVPTHWRVENSWGEDSGEKGYFSMSDDWFNEYTYQVVVEKQFLKPDVLAVLDQEPVILPPWDPMGALA